MKRTTPLTKFQLVVFFWSWNYIWFQKLQNAQLPYLSLKIPLQKVFLIRKLKDVWHTIHTFLNYFFKNQKKKYSKMPTIHKNFQNMSNKIARFSTQKQAIIPTNLNIAWALEEMQKILESYCYSLTWKLLTSKIAEQSHFFSPYLCIMFFEMTSFFCVHFLILITFYRISPDKWP